MLESSWIGVLPYFFSKVSIPLQKMDKNQNFHLFSVLPFLSFLPKSVKFVLLKKKIRHPPTKWSVFNGFFSPFESNQICEKYQILLNYQPHSTIKEAWNQTGYIFFNNKIFKLKDWASTQKRKFSSYQGFFNPCLYQLIQLHVIKNELLWIHC